MNTGATPKNFIFNEKIDSQFLFSLYADDYAYMEEVFSTTLQHFDQDFESIKAAYSSGSVADLKRAIHKIKPTFGFVGLPDVQEVCKQLEEKCQNDNNNNMDVLKEDYKQIVITLAESKDIIESEYRKLKDFNTNP